MPTHLCLTVRFLQPAFHGRGDRGEPEWPPSPLRAFQALVSASAARWSERTRLAYAVPALQWLERQVAPSIIAAVGHAASSEYRLYVPDNVGDEVARSWSRGGDKDMAGFRVEKDVQPTRLTDRFEAVHYLWPASDPGFEPHQNVLFEAARSMTHLGWGIDMVAAHASVLSQEEVGRLEGERWQPADETTGNDLRVPTTGTLEALIEKHHAFLNRLGSEGFRPVPPLTNFRVVGYHRASDSPRRPHAAFCLLKPNAKHASDFRSFDTTRRTMAIGGMLRHAAGQCAESLGWPDERIAQFVRGHGEPSGQLYAPVQGPRLAYLPLPSIEFRNGEHSRVVTGIRRALVTVLNGDDGGDLQRLSRLLSGSDLIGEETGGVEARLAQIHYSDKVLSMYTKTATTWASVTPVILPGHDDPRKIRKRLFAKTGEDAANLHASEKSAGLERLERRIDHLLRKAIIQAGYSDELARCAEIEWRSVGFWPGTEPATRYAFPNQLRRFRRLHVRISWRNHSGQAVAIPGPICLGGGRFCGLGVLAAVE